MMDLSNNIYRYYLEHFDELSFEKKFHFVSRNYLWTRETSDLLADMQDTFTCNGNIAEAIQQLVSSAAASPVHGSKNAAELRLPYFQKYPLLKPAVLALFRITFAKTVYGIDARNVLEDFFEATELERLAQELLADRQATAILSTHAINFLYLYSRVVVETELFDPVDFLDIGRQSYDTSDKTQLQLLIYLYTHCIIGESMFYYRLIPSKQKDTYLVMLQELEQLIINRYEDINLDNKFEFLVCAKLLGANSMLHDRINEEAAKSLSDQGYYLIDRHNNNPQIDNVSLDKSEHRNILCILANKPFSPIG
jgi:hypothetical protein